MRCFIVVTALLLAVLGTSPLGAQPIDQLPMYGGMDRSTDPMLKAADEKLIADTTRHYGSREAASKAFAEQAFKFYQRDDVVKAMRRFNQAWLLNPDSADPYWGFASVLSDRERYCDAAKHMETAMSKSGLQPGALPDAAMMFAFCAMGDPANTADSKSALLKRSEETFGRALNEGAPKDYTLLAWARAKFVQQDYAGAWAKVKELRSVTSSQPPAAFLRSLQAKMPEPIS